MYVWVLRNKPTEWGVLRKVAKSGRRIEPVVEEVQESYVAKDGRRIASIDKPLNALAARLDLATIMRIRLDFDNLLGLFSSSDVAEIMLRVQKQLPLFAVNVVPAIRSSSPVEIAEAAIRWSRCTGSGLLVRLNDVVHIHEQINKVMDVVKASGLPPSTVDILVDSKDRPRAYDHEQLADLLPIGQSARLYGVVSGVFPSGVTHLSADTYVHKLERSEWLAYLEALEPQRRWRTPIFGDYATQSSYYSPSATFRPSPTVRYTADSHYIVLRGRKSDPLGEVQYVGHARYLVQQEYFAQPLKTTADELILAKCDAPEHPGNGTTWRSISLSRHVQLAIAQTEAAAELVSRTSRR